MPSLLRELLKTLGSLCHQSSDINESDWSLIYQSVYWYQASVMNRYSGIEEYQRYLKDLDNHIEQQLNEAKRKKCASDL